MDIVRLLPNAIIMRNDTIVAVLLVFMITFSRGGSAGTRILYTHVTCSSCIRYANQSYVVVVQ